MTRKTANEIAKSRSPETTGSNRQNHAREINLCDHALLVDDDAGRGLHSGGEIHPRQKSTVIKNWIGQSLRWYFCQLPEKQAEDNHRQHRLKNGPGRADHGLLVANFNVAPHKEIEQLPVGPQFPQVQSEPAAPRLDADNGNLLVRTDCGDLCVSNSHESAQSCGGLCSFCCSISSCSMCCIMSRRCKK